MFSKITDNSGSFFSWFAAAFAGLIANLSDPNLLAAWLAVGVAMVRILVDLPRACRTVRGLWSRRNRGAQND